MILAGDIGGTSARLALLGRDESGRLQLLAERTFPSRDHDSLESVITLFLKEEAASGRAPAGRIEAASFGVAGPVRNGRSATTNLPWVVEASRLAEACGLRAAGLINDLVANAYGLDELGPADFEVLSPGAPGTEGNSAIISAGTGLGEAGIYWDGTRHHPFATEGGHADFSPRSDLEDALLRHLRVKFGRVSWERVLSGPGLVSIYEFLLQSADRQEDAGVADRIVKGDKAAAVSAAALSGQSPLASQALDLFVSLYGAEAGDLALKTMAVGGLYVGGGIAPRIIGRLRAGGFMESFLAKGRMRTLMESMPVRVVLNDYTALLGAARHAVLA